MNRYVVVAATALAVVVVAQRMQRVGATPHVEAPPALQQSPGEVSAAEDPAAPGIQVAQADPLPPVDAGGADETAVATDADLDGGAIGFPEPVAKSEENAADDAPTAAPATTGRRRVPLNPEEPLPKEPRARREPTRGPLTALDPHQMLFEPGEPPPRRGARARSRASEPASEPRTAEPTAGPLTAIDPRQMLFEPNEPAPKPARPRSAAAYVPRVVGASEPAVSEAPPAEAPAPHADAPPGDIPPAPDAQSKTRIMERLMRVMELSGEKP